MPNSPGVDTRVEVTGISWNRMISDLAYPVLSQRSPYASSSDYGPVFGPISVGEDPTATEGVDVGMIMDFEMGEHKESLDMST